MLFRISRKRPPPIAAPVRASPQPVPDTLLRQSADPPSAEEKLHSAEEKLQLAALPLPAPAAQAPPAQPAQALSATELSALMSQVVASVSGLCSVASNQASMNAAGISSTKAPPLQRLLDKAMESCNARTFFNVTQLNAKNIERLKFKEISSRDEKGSVKLGGGITIGFKDESIEQKKYDSFLNWDLFFSGFTKWIGILAQSKMACLVTDRMEWLAKVQAFHAVDNWHRAKYARDFMFKYAASDNWADIFHTDSALLFAMATKSSSSSSSDGHSSSQHSSSDRSSSKSKPVVKKRSRDSPHGKPASKAKVAKGKAPQRLCWSRVDQDKGECTYKVCRFSHICPCCKKDHPASSCRKFDQAVADAAAENA